MTRKKFLFISSLSILSTLFPNVLFANYTYKVDPSILSLLKKAKRSREAGRLNHAKSLYQEILSLQPTEVRAYNGLRKTLLGQKRKEYEVIQLYQRAHALLPNNLKIKRQLYNEYFKAAIGNRRVLKRINIEGRLLLYVRDKYYEMLSAYPEKKDIQKQLHKIEKYIELDVDIKNPHQNTKLKSFRKEQKKKHKKRFEGISAQQIGNMLAKLEAKPHSQDREHHVREISKVNIKTLRREKRYLEALTASEDFLNTKKFSDPYFIKQFRDLAKQLSQYDKLVRFESKNHTIKNNFWSAVSLFDALYRSAEYNRQHKSSAFDSVIKFMIEKSDDPQQQFELNTRKIKLELLRNNFPLAKEQLVKACVEMTGSSSSHLIDRINILWAKYYVKTGNYFGKNTIVEIAINPEKYLNNDDELKKATALLNIGRSYEKPIHIHNLKTYISSL